jgi:hypothetical protein
MSDQEQLPSVSRQELVSFERLPFSRTQALEQYRVLYRLSGSRRVAFCSWVRIRGAAQLATTRKDLDTIDVSRSRVIEKLKAAKRYAGPKLKHDAELLIAVAHGAIGLGFLDGHPNDVTVEGYAGVVSKLTREQVEHSIAHVLADPRIFRVPLRRSAAANDYIKFVLREYERITRMR